MVTNSEDPIVSLCDRLRLEHPALDQARLSRYLADTNSWNSRIPLISRKTPFQVLERLVRQSVLLHDYVSDQIVPHLPSKGLRIVDALSIAERLFEKNFPTLQEKAINTITRSIKKGGYLIIGASEIIGETEKRKYKQINKSLSIFKKK